MTTQSSEYQAQALLPAYIEARARHAFDAGLVTEKQKQRRGMLSTRYTGSEAQLRAARFLRIPSTFVFPRKLGGRKLAALAVFCPALPNAELKCTLAKIGEDRYRVSIVDELLPVVSRSLAGRVAVYKYTDLREGANAGPATVYVGPFASLVAAGIAPREAEHRARRASADRGALALWHSQPLDGGRYRFVVYHEAEARAHAQDEERGRCNFKTPAQYQDWLLEVAAASIGMIRRQLRIKTKGRYVYTVPTRTLKELESHLTRLRRTIARAEIIVEKEDVRAETRRAELRRAALAAMRDGEFQRFLGKVVTPPAAQRKR